MRSILISLGILITLIILSIAIFFAWNIKYQGLSAVEYSKYKRALITKDDHGIVSIQADSWMESIAAQGFVTASERFFQMDLMRRKADGSLSELFGESAFNYDSRQRSEDWRNIAELAYHDLPERQKQACDSLARGINEFLESFQNRAGIEYFILRARPLPWSCVDSLLITLLMADNMSHSWNRDLEMKEWHDALPQDWWNFVFPLIHPWNKPWFKDKQYSPDLLKLPLMNLKSYELKDEDFKINGPLDIKSSDGSNSWAYRGKNGAWLANDPHLGYQVPQLWFPIKLSTSDGWWVNGTTIPGIPGVLIGINENLSWSITNTAEDIDDAVILNESQPISEESRIIKIKNQSDRSISVFKSEFGPIVSRHENKYPIARHWLPLQKGILSLPMEQLNRAKDWDSFNRALDEFKFLPLNFTMLDQHQNMGLRISGCEIKRTANGDFAAWDQDSNWDSACSVLDRRRLFKPFKNDVSSDFIFTANERIWQDDKLHNWSDDDRAMRIESVLSDSDNLTERDMRLIQLDTTSRFHKELLNWLLKNGTTSFLTSLQKSDWELWTGNIKECPMCMTEASQAEKILDHLIVDIISKEFSKPAHVLMPVKRDMKRARILQIVMNPDLVARLGLDIHNLSTGVIKTVARITDKNMDPWNLKNRWTSQHPFVGRIPLLGNLFKIEEYEQYGASCTLRAESPTHGPSTRLIWNPENPDQSLWSFPIGISGHIYSEHFMDWLKIWQSGGMVRIEKNP